MRVLNYLMIFLIISISSSCSKNYVKPYEVYCPPPVKIVLTEADINKSLCDIDNIKIILNNFNDLIGYTKKLDSTIKCYEDSYKEVLGNEDK